MIVNEAVLAPDDGMTLMLALLLIGLINFLYKLQQERKKRKEEQRRAQAQERKSLSEAIETAWYKDQEAEDRQEWARANPRTPDAFDELKLMRARAADIPDLPLPAPRWKTRPLPFLEDDQKAHDKAA